MGVRKKLSEESFRPTYRLNGVQRGATIAECYDRYGRWKLGYRLGVLLRKTTDWVYVQWDGDDQPTAYPQGDARYKVDRGLWKVTNPRIGDPLRGTQGPALTTLAESARIRASANADSPPTEENKTEEKDMAKEMSHAAAERAAAQKALQNGDLRERDTYTAKQVATRCGTDAKTMRKFFRSKASTVEPVGQGGRYEFDAGDMPKIKREFDAWSNRGKKNGTPQSKKVEKAVTGMAEAIQGAVNSGVFEEDEEDVTMDQLADAIERAQDQEPVLTCQACGRDTDSVPHQTTSGKGSRMCHGPLISVGSEEPTEDDLEAIADLDLDDLDMEDL